MKRSNILLSLIALPLFHAGALDLTPRWIDTSVDGVPRRQLYFADGDKKFLLSIDRETEVNSRFGGAYFRFLKFPDIEFIVIPSQLKPTDAFDETNLVKYREAARSLVPARAKGAETTGEQANPIPINDWKSFRVQLRFIMDARAYTQEVTFVNVSDQNQIVTVTSAPERDWNEAGERSWQIFRSWQEMLPGDDGPPPGN